MSDLAQHIDKDSPAGFIGMPIGLGTNLCQQRIVQWFEQRRYCLQPTGQRARRHVQAVVGQVLQRHLTSNERAIRSGFYDAGSAEGHCREEVCNWRCG